MKKLSSKFSKLDMITKIGLSIVTIVNVPLIVLLVIKLSSNPVLHF